MSDIISRKNTTCLVRIMSDQQIYYPKVPIVRLWGIITGTDQIEFDTQSRHIDQGRVILETTSISESIEVVLNGSIVQKS